MGYLPHLALHPTSYPKPNIQLTTPNHRNENPRCAILCSVGLGKFVADEELVYTRCGTPNYVSPEVCQLSRCACLFDRSLHASPFAIQATYLPTVLDSLTHTHTHTHTHSHTQLPTYSFVHPSPTQPCCSCPTLHPFLPCWFCW